METSDYTKTLDPELCAELVDEGYLLDDITRELTFETPATKLDIEAFKLRHAK